MQSMENFACSSLYPGLDQYRTPQPGAPPGNIVVVVPPNNAEQEQKKFPRGNEALGAMQIVIAMIHIALGGILLFSAKEFVPLTMTVWFPFWGAGLFFISGYLASAAATKPVEGLAAASHIFNSFSGLGALAGICLLTIDLIKIFILNHQEVSIPVMNAIGFLSKYIVALPCEGLPNPADYCKTIKAYETGMLSVMLIFTALQAVIAFSTLRSNSDKTKKDKSYKDNEEQNVALLALSQRRGAEFTAPPQYATTDANRYSELPGNFHGNMFENQYCSRNASSSCAL
ncbi:B-lymphocyte antigen CD20-like [Hemicordylus capensis]|uniref:B-lymphocyte antigen CD20-like n=1 Tax=Hemicordylus capensis TaxID=884348 RepID=UPI0023020856|nr:B-lymphocyte antigen CD20-like [Hemicordylus capensis]